MPDIETIIQLVVVFAGGGVGAFVAVRLAIKTGAQLIPGPDPLEKADEWLEAKVDPWTSKITAGLDKIGDMLNADTNGGVGRGPDNPA